MGAISPQISAISKNEEMKRQRFRKLGIWARAMGLIDEIYKRTSKFPVTETYGLRSQLRRASISIAMNIAEGSGTGSDDEFNRF
jgi:hypothetical protein